MLYHITIVIAIIIIMITYLASDGEHLKAWSSASAISLPPLSSPQKAASVATPGPGRKILGDPVMMWWWSLWRWLRCSFWWWWRCWLQSKQRLWRWQRLTRRWWSKPWWSKMPTPRAIQPKDPQQSEKGLKIINIFQMTLEAINHCVFLINVLSRL